MKDNIEKAIDIIKSIDCLDDIELEQAIKTVINELERLQDENEKWQSAYLEEKEEQFKLIKLNQHIQKENEELKKANKCYINSIHSIVPVLNQDYIEKQKIKDKIEEVKNEEDLYARGNIIAILLELLEEEKQNEKI